MLRPRQNAKALVRLVKGFETYLPSMSFCAVSNITRKCSLMLFLLFLGNILMPKLIPYTVRLCALGDKS